MKSGRERVRKVEVMGRYVAKGVTPISPRVLEVHVNKQPGQEKVVVTDRATGAIMAFGLTKEIQDMLLTVMRGKRNDRAGNPKDS